MKYMPFMNGSGIKLIQNINVIKYKKHNVNNANFEMWGLLSIFSIFKIFLHCLLHNYPTEQVT